MIKSLLHLLQEDSPQLTRNYEVVSIRHQNREEHFQKRRQVTPQNQSFSTTPLDPQLAPLIRQYSQETFDPSQLFELVEEAQEEDILRKHRAIIGIRKIMTQLCATQPNHGSQEQSLVMEFTRNGSLAVLTSLCRMHQFPQLLYEATWCLTNIVSTSCIDWQALRRDQVLEVLLELAKAEVSPDIYDSAVICISNIALDHPAYRDEALEAGIIETIIHKLVTNSSVLSKGIVNNSCWVLSNLCRGRPLPKYQLIKEAFKYIACLLPYLIGTNILTDCLFALAWHSVLPNNNFAELVESEALSTIITAINEDRLELKAFTAAVRILGNVSAGAEQFNQHMLQHGLLTSIQKGLTHESSGIRMQTCWVLSNLAAGPEHHTQQVLAHPSILGTMIRLARQDGISVRKEACFFFANLTASLNPECYLQLIQGAEMIENLIELLGEPNSKLVQAVLDCLRTILNFLAKGDGDNNLESFLRRWDRSGGKKVLQQLQLRQDPTIYLKTCRIIKSYFEIESEHEFHELPTASHQGWQSVQVVPLSQPTKSDL